MHQALLIDELLRQIALFTLECDRKTLVCAARTCRAWKDPALDFIWERLPSLEPLLLLLPGVVLINGEYTYTNLLSRDLHTFNSYAKRVKHIRNTHSIKLNSSLGPIMSTVHSQFPALPNLSTTYISIPRCNEHLILFNISFKLKRVDIDLGFKAQGRNIEEAMCNYLERLQCQSHELRHLTLRGNASPRLNGIISNMSNLESISLCLGNSLLPKTFATIFSFPHLQELEVHAGHIHTSDVEGVWENESCTSFIPLRKMHVRAKSSLIESVLESVQPDVLQHLHIELDDSSPSHSSWEAIFDIISHKASSTIQHLTFEHHFDIPEQSLPTHPDPTTSQNGAPRISSMQFESLKKLSKLPLLRQLSCDLTLPLVVDEQDLQSVVSWWPLLDYLNLGLTTGIDDPNQYITPAKLTPAVLSLFATKLPNLRTLILPSSIDDLLLPPAESQAIISNRLNNITIAGLETSNPQSLAKRLRTLFPALQNLEGPCDDTPTWKQLKTALQES